ncbi:MAG: hypothetical protein AAGB31_07070 [Bdellovibrio sp.]
MIKKISITTGDTDGIGLEVAAKALYELKKSRDIQFILWRAHDVNPKYLRLLKDSWRPRQVTSWEEALRDQKAGLIDLASDLLPPQWVELSAQAAFKKEIHESI